MQWLLRTCGYPGDTILSFPSSLGPADERYHASFAMAVLALRTLVVAYGDDEGSLLDIHQRNHQVRVPLCYTW